MGSDDERKSRKHDGSGSGSRSRHKHHRDSSRDRDRDRHGSNRKKDRKRDRDRSDRERYRDDRHSRDKDQRDEGTSKLTEEEERLYAKARAFIERQEEEKGKKKESGSHNNDGKKRRDRDDDNDDDDSGDSQDREDDRHRDGKHSHRSSKHHHDRHKRLKKDTRRDKEENRHDKHRKSDRKKDRKRSRSRSRSRDRDRDRDRHSKHSKHHDDEEEKDRHKKKKKKSKHHHRDKGRNNDKHNENGNSEDDDDSENGQSFLSKATRIDKSKLYPLGKILHQPPPPSQTLDPDTDYFSHNSHLRLYLYRTHGIYFEDLTSAEGRAAFGEFTSQYNSGELEEAYYDAKGILPQEALDQCQRTKHQWKFRTNRVEERSLEVVREGVRKQTEYDADNPNIGTSGSAHPSVMKGPTIMKSATNPQLVDSYNNNRNNQNSHNHGRTKTPEERAAQKLSDKRHRQRIHLANEEMNPHSGKPESGYERQIEKRRQTSEATHGSARDREAEAYGGMELGDADIYGGRGGGDVSYEEALAREKRYKAKKEAEKKARMEEILQKEEEKKRNMLDMLGLSGIGAREKIRIAPRNDGNGGGGGS